MDALHRCSSTICNSPDRRRTARINTAHTSPYQFFLYAEYFQATDRLLVSTSNLLRGQGNKMRALVTDFEAAVRAWREFKSIGGQSAKETSREIVFASSPPP